MADKSDDLVARARRIAPRQVEGQSPPFAFRMDGLSLFDLNGLVNDLADTLAAHKAEIARLREALEPSGDTKAAYMGEFSFTIMTDSIDEDDDDLVPMDVPVPWTTIKEIMAAIKKRALKEAEQ